jgi:hypothetical protein
MSAKSILTEAARIISLALKDRGFKRVGLKFLREGEEVASLIEFQMSRTGVVDKGSFVINFGVIVPVLFVGQDLTKPTYFDCHWSARVSDEEGVEIWWTVRSSDDPRELAIKLTEILERKVFASLDSIQREADLIEIWQTGKGRGLTEAGRLLSLGILLHRARRHSEAADVRKALEQKAKSSFDQRAVRQLRELEEQKNS